jgi:hypothetical protein
VGGLVGPGLADRCRIRPPSGAPLSRSSVRPWSRRVSTQSVATSSSAMPGTTDRAAPLTCTTA